MLRLRSALGLACVLAVGLGTGGVSLLAYATDSLRRLEQHSIDLRFGLRAPQPLEDVLVVAIDDVTFDELRMQWPFRRSVHARAIERLHAAGARRIAYDVQFTEPTTPREDLALYEAVARAGNVVLATTEVDEHGGTNVLGGDGNLRAAGARAAHASLRGDVGGVIRRVPHSVDGLDTVAVASAAGLAGRAVPPGPFGERGALIDYAGPPGSVPTVSFSRLLSGRVDDATVRGRVVVVGASAPTLQDVHPASTSGDELMAGPEVQANAISTVLRGLPLREPPRWTGAVGIVLLVLLSSLAGAKLRPGAAAAVSGGLLATILVTSQLAFEAGVVLPVTYLAGSFALATIGTLGANYAVELRERARTRRLFARFVPEQVVDELLDRSQGEARLGGVRREATVMFCDLRGFTGFAERSRPERVIEVLNLFLTEMSEAILDHGGTLVSYMGDGIMAVFGSPIERQDHADAALAAAREMIRLRLGHFNAALEADRTARGFRMGIGLSSGPVMSGHVGSERRLEYAAIGDTTNVAARLESMTKNTPYQLFLADSTRASLTGHAADLVDLGPVEMRGRDATVRVWALPDRPGDPGVLRDTRSGAGGEPDDLRAAPLAAQATHAPVAGHVPADHAAPVARRPARAVLGLGPAAQRPARRAARDVPRRDVEQSMAAVGSEDDGPASADVGRGGGCREDER